MIAVPVVIATYASPPWPRIMAAARATGPTCVRRGGGGVDFVRAGQIVGGAFLLSLLIRRSPATSASTRATWRAARDPRSSLARPPSTRASSARPQALGHALGRHPHHGHDRRHPHQVRLHDTHRDRRVPAHVQLHPDLPHGHRAARARAQHAAPVPGAAARPGCWRLRRASRSRSPSTRSSPTVRTTWSAV